METTNHPLQPLLDLLPPGDARNFLAGPGGWIVLGAVALTLLLIAAAVLHKLWRMLFRRRPAPPPNLDRALEESLAEYPLPPRAGPQHLTIEGIPVRVRLVVVAAMGRQLEIDENAIEGLLDQVVRGLGSVLHHDRPRVRVWPSQLSSQGFTVKFHRLTHRPEAEGQASHWILVAGQTPARPRPLLVGLALYAGEANHVGRLTLEPKQWTDVLRVRSTDS